MTATPLVALVGNPNAGKTSLFNALTGARQKVGNYPGVTVERKIGRWSAGDGFTVDLIDLPGTYSLDPRSPDEAVTRNVVMGKQAGERRPDVILAVVDATNLDNHLRFILQLKALDLPLVVALNMIDLAERDALVIDTARLEERLGVPVIPTVAVRKRGLAEIAATVSKLLADRHSPEPLLASATDEADEAAHDPAAVRELQREAREIAAYATLSEGQARRWSHALDSLTLHPVLGPILLALILFVMFQAVFAWAEAPMAMIDGMVVFLQDQVAAILPEGWLRSLLVDGVLAGVGAVVVFLPQIIILFFFILLLEQSGYMVRAAFLMDKIMAHVGLTGRGFIPLLSSFACAVPGIMATRTIEDPKDRLTTILIAPLMTCSARLPVYAVIIAAFIPDRSVGFGIGLQGLTLFALYLSGIVGALIAAFVLRRTVTKGVSHGFLMEMPKYQLPRLRDLLLGLWQRAWIFLRRAGTIILASTMVLWLLLSFPKPPADADRPALDYSVAGQVAHGLAVVLKPIGFNEEISLALIPAMAAREVAVSALGTVYSLQGDEDAVSQSLVDRLRGAWPLPTALAFLAWFVFAPQCISTLAITRRETNSWRWPAFMLAYLFALAYVAAGVTFWSATALGL